MVKLTQLLFLLLFTRDYCCFWKTVGEVLGKGEPVFKLFGSTTKRSPLALAGEKVLAGERGEPSSATGSDFMAELDAKRSVRIKVLSMGNSLVALFPICSFSEFLSLKMSCASRL